MRIITLSLFSLLLLGAGCASWKKGNNAAKESPLAAALSGTWVLDVIPHSAGLDSLYPLRKPEVKFDLPGRRFSGFTGCNVMNGPLVGQDHTISFRGDIAMTMMACPGEGEGVFLENLKKVNRFDVTADGKTLNMIQGDIALLRFHKK